MKIKLDDNLPAGLVPLLAGLGHDVDTVIDEGLASANDDELWKGAQGAGRLLVTQDLDFSDIRKFKPGTHCGIVLVRLRDPSRAALSDRLRWLFTSEPVEEWVGCFVVVTEHKLRVSRHEPFG